jgi:hypothetical protein
MSAQTRFPALHDLLTGNTSKERQRALEDLKLAQHRRQTQAAHQAFKKARALTCEALRVGQ